MPEEVRTTIIEYGTLVRYDSGKILFNVGDDPEYVYLINNGRVKMCHIMEDGSTVTYFPHLAGELVGLGGVVDECKRTAMAIVDSNGCEMWCIPAEDFKRLMLTDAHVSYYVAVMAVKRFGVLGAQYRRHVAMHVEKRFPAVILDLANSIGIAGKEGIVIKATQQEIADILGIARQTAASMIREYRNAGIIDVYRGKMIVKDIDLLKQRIN